MKIKVFICVVAVTVLTSGCMSLYRYESTGKITSASGDSSRALLYWFGEEGGLWYDKEIIDSGVNLNVCEGIPKSFVPIDTNSNYLQLRSASNDQKVANRNGDGSLVELSQPQRLRVGKGNCGQIEVGQEQVKIDDLNENGQPELIILCENTRSATSYPKFGRYQFSAINRTEVENRDPVSACAN